MVKEAFAAFSFMAFQTVSFLIFARKSCPTGVKSEISIQSPASEYFYATNQFCILTLAYMVEDFIVAVHGQGVRNQCVSAVVPCYGVSNSIFYTDKYVSDE